MNQIIKTKIDGVPVEIEIVKMGPATAPEIKNLEKNIAKEDKNYVLSPPQQVKVVKIGENGNASPEEVAKVKKALEESKDPAALIQDLVTSISNIPSGKDWWTSKTVWINGLAIITALLAYFNVDFQIDPELFAVILPVLIGLINLWLRKGTATPLTKRIVPGLPAKNS